MAGERLRDDAMPLFARHEALFVDKEDDDSVFPRLHPGRADKAVSEAFDAFYFNTSVYDLVNQWIAAPGPFKHEMRWLFASASDEEAAQYRRRAFKAAFDLDIEQVEVLTNGAD